MGWKCTKFGYSTGEKPNRCPKCGNAFWRCNGVKNRGVKAGSVRGTKRQSCIKG